jgi:YD repeat-containing protein
MKTIIIILVAAVVGVATLHADNYVYDAAGRLVRVVHDNGMETIYTFDKNGNLTAKKTDLLNSVNDDATSVKVSASPQPSREWVTIRIDEWEGAVVHVTLTNVNGDVVQRVTRHVQNGSFEIDVRHLAAATYNVAIVADGRQTSTRITVIK